MPTLPPVVSQPVYEFLTGNKAPITEVPDAETPIVISGIGSPSGAAGGVLSGTYPNPGFASDMATQAELDAHTINTSNPHSVTKSQIGLGSVDNTSDANKPVSSAQAAADSAVATAAASALTAHATDLTNPHNVTKGQVGLGNVDNTSDANKPVSIAQATAIGVVQSDIDAHEADTANPHAVTKSQVGLANVDNTSDASKPVSTAQATAIAVVQSDVDTHESDTANPHVVTKTQVGLGNADNTSDVNKPVSTAQAAADSAVATAAATALSTHTGNISNPHSVTKAQVGLGSADNTSDAGKPVSTAQATAIAVVQSDVDGHEADTANPHAVTKAQVGLSAVTNDAQTKAAVMPNTAPTNGQIPIGRTATGDYIPASITAGANITITPGPGTLQIAASGASAVALTTNFLTGLVITSNATDAVNDIDIAAGAARNSADDANMVATALVKQQDVVWAVGTNAGGMYQSAALTSTIAAVASTTTTGVATTFLTDFVVGDVITDTTGSQSRRITAIASDTSLTVATAWTVASLSGYKRGGKAANTAYYIYLIRRSDTGVVDVLFSTRNPSQTLALPASYDSSRLVGGFHNNGTPAVDGVFNTDGFTASGYQTINYTTTLATNVDTGMFLYAAANEGWIVYCDIDATAGSGGGKIQITAPTSATVKGWSRGEVAGVPPATVANVQHTAINTLSTVVILVAANDVRTHFRLANSSTAGAVAIGVGSVTGGNTTTVNAQSNFTARRR